MREVIQKDSSGWATRKKLAHLLYNEGKTKEAAEVIWDAAEIPNLDEVTAENVVHEMYVQSPRVASDPSPPPAVTIPMDRVDPKHIVVDAERGAGEPISIAQCSGSHQPH